MPNPNKGTEDMYRFYPINATDNNGLDQIEEKLELIYTRASQFSPNLFVPKICQYV